MVFWYIVAAVFIFVIYNVLTGRFADFKKKFGDKVVVIVGASSGIGEELAYQVSEYHPKLVLAARRLEKLEEIKKKCEGRGATSVLTIQAAITSEEDCKRIMDMTVEKLGKIDVLFLNAGVALTSTLFKLESPAPLKSVFDTDLLGSVYPAFYALPHLRKSAGHIVVTSSAYGKFPGLGISAYCASKHALHGFFDCLRAEETRNRIKVTIVCPGYVKTQIHDRALGSDGKEVGPSPKKLSSMFSYTETTVRDAVRRILRATAANKTELYFPILVSIAVHLRGLLGPGLFDWLVYGSK